MGTKPWKRQVSPAAGDVFASVRTFRGTGKERKMNMKQFARSAIALFCVLVLCMGLVPVYTFADEGEVSAPAEETLPEDTETKTDTEPENEEGVDTDE